MSARFHPVVFQQISEYLEILRFIYTSVLLDFVEIREGTPLSGFMTHERHRDWCIGHILTIVGGDACLEVHH